MIPDQQDSKLIIQNDITISFNKSLEFNTRNIIPLNGITGLYFIFNNNIEIAYPFKKSKLIYIGMSEKKTNSIGKRLQGHYRGKSGNSGLTNYRKVNSLAFTHINFEMLRNIWPLRIEDLESYFILDFVEQYGVYPICNNKSGFNILKDRDNISKLIIDWRYFE